MPVYNVANACATGATAIRTVVMAIKSGEAQIGLAVGAEQMGKMGLLGGGATKKEKKVFEPSGRYGAVTGVDGHLGTETMPGVFAQAGMAYAHDHDGVGFEQFARVAYKKPSPLDAQPAGAVPEGVLHGRDHGVPDDELPQHRADVLPDRRRRGRSGAGCRGSGWRRCRPTSGSGR